MGETIMSVQYSNVGNPISQALGGLTQYLMIENQRLDAEQKEKKINLAAEQIAEGYQNLPPDATISDIQKLQYQLIDDAAALGGLQENMPLLSTLYQGAMTTREMQKMERRDSALFDYVSRKYGLDGLSPEAGGEVAASMVELRRNTEREVPYTDAQGRSVLNVYNDDGSLAHTMKQSDFGPGEAWPYEKQKLDYAFNQDLKKLNYAHNLANPTLTASGPQITGMDLYTNSQGVGGETLYKSHKNGGTYFLNKKTNQVEPYWGQIQKISGKTGTGQVQDILATMQTNTNTFQPQRLGLVQTLGKVDGGLDFMKALTKTTDLPQDKDDILSMGAVTAMDTALRGPDAMKKLQTLYEETPEEKRGPIGEIMQAYNSSLSNQMNFENMIKSTMPDSPYDGPGLLTSEEYERTSEGLFQIFNNKTPDSVSAPIRSYIAKIAGVDVRNVNESVFRTLGRQQQDKIMQKLLPLIKYN